MDRTFHRRFTVGAKSGIALFSLLALYFFWTKTAVIGLLLLIVVVGMIERVIHTTYTFRRVKPIDSFWLSTKGGFRPMSTFP